MKIDTNKLKRILIDFMIWQNEDEDAKQITEDEIDLYLKEKHQPNEN